MSSGLLVYGLGACEARDTPSQDSGLLFRAGDRKQLRPARQFSALSSPLSRFLACRRSLTGGRARHSVAAAGAGPLLCRRRSQHCSFWLMRSPARKGFSLSIGLL